MTTRRLPLYTLGLFFAAALLLGLALWKGLPVHPPHAKKDGLELDVKSNYSRIRIVRKDNLRALWFIRDSGEQVIESMLDLQKPYALMIEYTRYMFSSYLFRPSPDKVLIIGLGGGSMVHFLRFYDPKVKVDAVEIDPVIVELADKYFGVRSGGPVDIKTGDGAEYLLNTDSKYDVIYMDAFLKPSGETDDTGVPLQLKTVKFYKEVQKKLSADGVVVFNLNSHPRLDNDVKNIRASFPQTYVFQLPSHEGLVVVGSMNPKRARIPSLITDAQELDRRFRASFSFREMIDQLAR